MAFSLAANAQESAPAENDSTKAALKAAKPKKESVQTITANYLGTIPTGGHAAFIRFSNSVVNGLGSDFALSSDFQNYVGLHLDCLNYTFEFTKPTSNARLFIVGAFGLNESISFHGETVADHFNTSLSVSPRLDLLISNKVVLSAGYRGSFCVTPSVYWGNAFNVGVGFKL